MEQISESQLLLINESLNFYTGGTCSYRVNRYPQISIITAILQLTFLRVLIVISKFHRPVDDTLQTWHHWEVPNVKHRLRGQQQEVVVSVSLFYKITKNFFSVASQTFTRTNFGPTRALPFKTQVSWLEEHFLHKMLYSWRHGTVYPVQYPDFLLWICINQKNLQQNKLLIAS